MKRAQTLKKRVAANTAPLLPQELLRFPQLPDAFPDAILITDTQGNIAYVNPAWEKLTGYTFKEVSGKNPRFLKSEKTPNIVYKKLWHALTAGKLFRSEEITNRKKNGTEYSIRAVFFPIRYRGKNIYYAQVLNDITDRIKLEERLKESEKKYRDLMDKSSEGIIVYAADGHVVEVNRKICTMLGYTKKQMHTYYQNEINDPEDQKKNPLPLKDILAGKTIRNERLLVKKDGSRLPVELTAKLQPNGTIEILYRDISLRKKLEKQKDTFIGVAAHELKTPITSLKAYEQLMSKKLIALKLDDLINLNSRMNLQISRLTELIDDLLNVNRIASGRLELFKKKHDLNTTLHETVTELQPVLKTHKISIRGKVTKKISFDDKRIRQVLTNLLTNAVKYSPSANKVIISVDQYENVVQVGVKDFGFGIDTADQEKIFELFYRTTDKEESSISGFGLGLYIAAEIIKRHRGRLWVKSKKGRGSTFYFSLPR